jgi:CRISPR-associated endonuclease Csy4
MDMNHYIEITLRPDAEVGLGFIWQKVYQQIHLALVEVKDANEKVNVGVSFPKYGAKTFPLGDTVRLFGKTPGDLKAVRLDHWLERLSDYVSMTGVQKVPQHIKTHVCFKRKQPKIDFMKRVERQAKRHGVSIEAAFEHFKNYDKEHQLTLPFVSVFSQTWKQHFPLFVEKNNTTSGMAGQFDTYGLSKEATVPWF